MRDWSIAQWLAAGLFVATVIAVPVVSGLIGPSGSITAHPAALVVDEALGLRRDLENDPSRLAPYFMDSAVATELADSARNAQASPIPGWQMPYASKVGSSSADVVVIWDEDPAYAGWPAAHVFSLAEVHGRWVISDAREVTGAPPPAATGE